jgi:RimJ/RimL family protein N-acetyltransferase
MERWAKPTIEGTLVTLRPLAATDTEAAWEMVQDPEGHDLTATTATFEYEQILAWCASRATAPDRLDLAIVERATGQFAGEVVLNEFDAVENTANFRIALRGPAWYGRGLGGEATQLIVRHGLQVVGLDRITLEVLARNPRARRAYESAGFVVSGEFEEDGETWLAMAITAGDSR